MSTQLRRAGTEGPASAEALVARFRAGDDQAFDELVRLFQTRLFNFVYRMLNDREEAADLTQEIFVKVYDAIPGFRGESGFATWLYAVAANMSRNRLRRLNRIRAFETVSLDAPLEIGDSAVPRPAASPDPSPSEAVARADAAELLKRTLAELPADFGAAVVMRDVQGMTYEEIAGAFRCSIGTVKSRIARGRMLIKNKMQKVCGSP
jgi:RNA polymerase sigma-70 factor (ECF subfamily)